MALHRSPVCERRSGARIRFRSQEFLETIDGKIEIEVVHVGLVRQTPLITGAGRGPHQ
jgi:hypothetical protein